MGPNHALRGKYRMKFTKLSKYIQYQCLWAAHAAETLFAECGERGHHKLKPAGIERSSPGGHRKKTQRAPAVVRRLRIHRGLGLEKQLDHLRTALARRFVQWGPTSVRSPFCGRSSGNPGAPSRKMMETVHAGGLSCKTWYQVVGVHVCVSRPFSYSLLV